jgi:hypothetical protein
MVKQNLQRSQMMENWVDPTNTSTSFCRPMYSCVMKPQQVIGIFIWRNYQRRNLHYCICVSSSTFVYWCENKYLIFIISRKSYVFQFLHVCLLLSIKLAKYSSGKIHPCCTLNDHSNRIQNFFNKNTTFVVTWEVGCDFSDSVQSPRIPRK